MNTFTCSYVCRYSSCSGRFAVLASSIEEARQIARQQLIENGGLEGIAYSVQ